MRKKRTSRGLVLAAASTPLLLALMVTVARAEGEYDANGESMTPILCPLALPVDGMVNLLPNIPFQVPQFDPLHRSTETVPFTVSSYTYTSQVQPVTMGFGWYRPSPNTTFYGGLNWVWTGPGGGGGVLFTCNRHAYLFGAIIETVYASTGDRLGVRARKRHRPGNRNWQRWQLRGRRRVLRAI